MLNTKIFKIPENLSSDAIGSYSIAGSGTNGLLLLAKSNDLTTQNRKTLSDILKAIKYNLEESTLVAYTDENAYNIGHLVLDRHIKTVLTFGLSCHQIGLQIATPAYKVITLEGFNIIFSHCLTDLNLDKKKKLALWQSIQLI